MVKFYLEYDPNTGQITDGNGNSVYTYLGAEPIVPEVKNESIVLELAKQGFTADDIINLKRAEVLNNG